MLVKPTPVQRISKNLKVPQDKAKDLIKSMLAHAKRNKKK